MERQYSTLRQRALPYLAIGLGLAALAGCCSSKNNSVAQREQSRIESTKIDYKNDDPNTIREKEIKRWEDAIDRYIKIYSRTHPVD